MAEIRIRNTNQRIKGDAEVGAFLNNQGVLYEHWQIDKLPQNIQNKFILSDEEKSAILNTFDSEIKDLASRNGYRVWDVVALSEATPNIDELLKKFEQVHTHTEDEVRFFVDGQGHFWFNLEDGKTPVFNVLLQAGDLISVPANTKHWFDAGEHNPFVKTIRIFIDQSGWVPHYTGSKVEQAFL